MKGHKHRSGRGQVLRERRQRVKIGRILSFVLYGCEAWSLTLREERRLWVFENRILRPILGPKRDGNGKWRRLHKGELHSLYHSPDVVRVIKTRILRWAGHVARIREGRSAFKILTGDPTGKWTLGRPWRKNVS